MASRRATILGLVEAGHQVEVAEGVVGLDGISPARIPKGTIRSSRSITTDPQSIVRRAQEHTWHTVDMAELVGDDDAEEAQRAVSHERLADAAKDAGVMVVRRRTEDGRSDITLLGRLSLAELAALVRACLDDYREAHGFATPQRWEPPADDGELVDLWSTMAA